MLNLTWDRVRTLQPCPEALAWGQATYDGQPSLPAHRVLRDLMKANKWKWANWLLVRVMSYEQYVRYAVFAAEQVLAVHEKRYPNDPRPRQAIDAAKACVKNPSKESKAAALVAAGDALAAALAAAWAAAWAAAKKRMQLKILRYGMKLLQNQ